MESSDYQKLQYHLKEISSLLYRNTPAEQLTSAEMIETTVRQQLLTEIAPKIGEFFFTKENPHSENKLELEN